MAAQASRESIRLRGEKAPLLVLIGFALAGLIGSIITAWLLLPNPSAGLNLGPPRIADTHSATLKPLPVPRLESGKTTVVPDLVDNLDAMRDEESDRAQVKEEAALAIRLSPVESGAPEVTLPDDRVGGIEAVGVPASVGPNAQLPATQKPLGGQASVLQGDPGPTSEADEGFPLAEEKRETPDLDDMELDAPGVTAPDTRVSGIAAIGAPAGGPTDQSPATLESLGEPTMVPQSDLGLTSEKDEWSLLVEEKHETPDRDSSVMATLPEAEAAKSIFQSTEGDAKRGAGSEQTVNEAVPSDCAPLFSVTFRRGDDRPQVADMRQKIEGLAAWLAAHPTAILSLDGHADASGPEEFNLLLSFRRAASVAALLEDAGTSKTQIVVRAHGEGQSSSRSADAALERRVSLTVDVGEPCGEPSDRDGGLR